MFKETPATADQLPVNNNFELSFNSPENLAELKTWLEPLIGAEGADQCVFVLQAMAAEDYTNQCDKAAAEFGRKLNTRFGDEESFFDLVPEADYYDASSTAPLSGVGYTGKHHSVGLLEIKRDSEVITLVFDLNYGAISRGTKQETALVIKVNGANAEALKKLADHHGGKWEIDYKLDKATNHLVFQDKR